MYASLYAYVSFHFYVQVVAPRRVPPPPPPTSAALGVYCCDRCPVSRFLSSRPTYGIIFVRYSYEFCPYWAEDFKTRPSVDIPQKEDSTAAVDLLPIRTSTAVVVWGAILLALELAQQYVWRYMGPHPLHESCQGTQQQDKMAADRSRGKGPWRLSYARWRGRRRARGSRLAPAMVSTGSIVGTTKTPQ